MGESLREKTKTGVYWSFFNNFANFGMSFVIGIVMARLLTPQDYGITALPAVFMAIAGVFIDSGFSSALVRKEDLKEEDLSTAFYYSFSVGLLCYIILFISSPFIADFYNTPILKKLIRVAALSFLISPLSTPQTVILSRRLDFKTPTKISIVSRILTGVVGIVLAYTGFGLWALVISTLLSTVLMVIFNWLAVRWFPKTGWSKDSFKYLFGFGSKMLVVFLVDKIYTNIAPIFIGKQFSTADLGMYNRAQGYAQLPSNQLTSVVQNVTFPVLSKIQNDDESLRRNYRKILRVTAYIVFPVMFLLAVMAEPFIVVFITDKWLECVPYLQIMCFWFMWLPIHSLNLNLLMVKGRSDLFLRLEIIKKAIGVTIMIITLPMGIIPFLFGSLINSLIALVINTFYTGKLINVGFFKQMGDIFPILLNCTFMLIVTYLVSSLIDNMIVKLLVGCLSGCVVYALTSILFKFPELEEVKFMISRKK